MANPYTIATITEFTDDIEFTEWLASEGFINIDSVYCDHCNELMHLQGIYRLIFPINENENKSKFLQHFQEMLMV